MVLLKSVGFGYGKRPLFEGMDLVLKQGSIYGLLGLNGAGKTSLLKLIAGALITRSGSIEVFGRNPAMREARHLANVAFVPEDPWAPALKSEDWLSRYAIFRPDFDAARFKELCAEFSLEQGKLLSRYSYGQRKKFALAAALSSGAKLILLDEPTNGLDIPSKTQFRRILAASAQDDRIIVVSTHQVRDLENLIDPVLVINDGRLAFNIDAECLSARLGTERLSDLSSRPVVYAERDALGWTAIVAGCEGAAPADLELVFNAAIAEPGRLEAALAGSALSAYSGAIPSPAMMEVR